VPEPTVLFADCGCRFRIRVPLGSQTGELVRDLDCGTHLDIRTGRVARQARGDMPVGEGIPANICSTCGQVYDEDYCPACEELE